VYSPALSPCARIVVACKKNSLGIVNEFPHPMGNRIPINDEEIMVFCCFISFYLILPAGGLSADKKEKGMTRRVKTDIRCLMRSLLYVTYNRLYKCQKVH